MAFIGSGAIGSSSPKLAYEFYTENVSASGTIRTIKLIGRFKVNGTSSASRFGYACSWRPKIWVSGKGYTYGSWAQFKGTEVWYATDGYRQFEQNITIDTGYTSSISITPAIDTSSSGTSSWTGEIIHGTVSTVVTNSAPYFPSGASLVLRNGSATGEVLSGTIAENITKIHASWTGAKDNEGGTINYSLTQNPNGTGWSRVSYGTATSSVFDVSMDSTSLQYCVQAVDSGNLWSTTLYSSTLARNVFTPATLTADLKNLYYSDKNQVITIGCVGESNTNGDKNFTKTLTSNDVIIFNPEVIGDSSTITIWKTGDKPTTPYIRWDELVFRFENSNYKGTLILSLETANAFGSSKISSIGIDVDLRTAPIPVSSCTINTDKTLSTAIKTNADNGNEYFIPNGMDIIRVDWVGGTCKLYSALTYEIQVAIGGGSYMTVAHDLPSTTKYYDYIAPTQSTKQDIKFRVIAKTSFGYTSSKDSPAETLHFYNPPALSVSNIVRTESGAEVNIAISSLTSLLNLGVIGSWKLYKVGSTIALSQGTLQSAQTQTVELTGMTGSDKYTLVVNFNDDTGFTVNSIVKEISIGVNFPVLDINKHGIGVHGSVADEDFRFKVNGKGYSNEGFRVGNENSDKFVEFNMQDSNFASIESNANKGLLSKQNMYVQGEIYAGEDYSNRVYHEGNKPTLEELGALGKNEKASDSELVGGLKFENFPTVATLTHLWGTSGADTKVQSLFPLANVNVGSANTAKGISMASAPRVSSLNNLTTSGFFAFGSGATGAPCSYGVVLHIIWGSSNSAQAVWSVTTGSMYIRYYNNSWSAWRTW